jgi:hypothetical protein
MISGGEVPPRPPDYWGLQFPYGFKDIPTESLNMRNLRIFPYPNAPIDAFAQVLNELSIDSSIELSYGGVCIHKALAFQI